MPLILTQEQYEKRRGWTTYTIPDMLSTLYGLERSLERTTEGNHSPIFTDEERQMFNALAMQVKSLRSQAADLLKMTEGKTVTIHLN